MDCNGDDCDDTDPSVYPNAPEGVNGNGDGKDNDCDGETDEDVTTTYYIDGDGDGYGNPDISIASCDVPAGFVVDGTDCDDGNPYAFDPNAEEVCDTVDNNCDGQIDEGVTTTYWYDNDRDGELTYKDIVDIYKPRDPILSAELDRRLPFDHKATEE